VSVEAIAARIAAEPADVAALLDQEEALGRLKRSEGGRWTLVAGAFPPETVEALRTL
jgi:hypothetical protein